MGRIKIVNGKPQEEQQAVVAPIRQKYSVVFSLSNGIKVATGGKEYPKSVGYFVAKSLQPNKQGDFRLERFNACYSDKPTCIYGQFVTESPVVLYYEFLDSDGKWVAKINYDGNFESKKEGVTQNGKVGENEIKSFMDKVTEKYPKGKWSEKCILFFALLDKETFLADDQTAYLFQELVLTRFKTSASASTIGNLYERLSIGKLLGIKFSLSVKMHTSFGKGTASKYPVVDIDLISNVEALKMLGAGY